jgi:ParB family chromosome partitioning protein
VSRPQRVGLPQTIRMRHESHFVDQLARPGGTPVGRLIPIEDIEPNPDQPRQAIGDLSELIASVREKGVLEPILVRSFDGRFQIIAGERRFRAAIEAGLDEIPCIVRETSDAETMEIALIENLQRQDLTPFEEADGLKALADRHGYTHEKMAARLGKKRTSITESLSLTHMPEAVRELCRLADIHSKSLLLQVVRQTEPEKMVAFLERLRTEGGATREDARKLNRQAKGRAAKGRPKHYVFRFQPKEKSFNLSLQFRKSQVARDEIVRALQSIIEDLMREDD